VDDLEWLTKLVSNQNENILDLHNRLAATNRDLRRTHNFGLFFVVVLLGMIGYVASNIP
jgi:hypothetical protein